MDYDFFLGYIQEFETIICGHMRSVGWYLYRFENLKQKIIYHGNRCANGIKLGGLDGGKQGTILEDDQVQLDDKTTPSCRFMNNVSRRFRRKFKKRTIIDFRQR
jgi:hypothetical protein